VLPEFKGKLLLIHEHAQEKEIEIRPMFAHLILDFFSQQKTKNALHHRQLPKRAEDCCLMLFQPTKRRLLILKLLQLSR
jgi:hypothetical protein